jgi:hypothetical protein
MEDQAMGTKNFGSRKHGKIDAEKLNRIVAEARQEQAKREQGYREQSLKIHPWICGRCGREFTAKNVHLLTVHHKDHNHDNNPPDGSNWENLCVYCHDNEHSRYHDFLAAEGAEIGEEEKEALTHNPFAALKDALKEKKA